MGCLDSSCLERGGIFTLAAFSAFCARPSAEKAAVILRKLCCVIGCCATASLTDSHVWKPSREIWVSSVTSGPVCNTHS